MWIAVVEPGGVADMDGSQGDPPLGQGRLPIPETVHALGEDGWTACDMRAEHLAPAPDVSLWQLLPTQHRCDPCFGVARSSV